MRGHNPIPFENFKGLWRRGNQSSCPPDHFNSCKNIDFDEDNVKERALFAFIQDLNKKVVTSYIYRTGQYVLLMIGDDLGDLYYIDITAGFPNVPTLVHAGATGTRYTDWITINGRLYLNEIGPGETYYFGGVLSTYNGVTYRSAGGTKPIAGAFASANSATAGHVDAGLHYFGVAYETDSGYITQISFAAGSNITAPGNKSVDFTNIPVSGDARVVARRLIATRAIVSPSVGTDVTQFTSYFIPNGRIADNVTTAITLDFTDSQLLEEATYLNDISDLSLGPSGIALGLFNNRLVMGGWLTNPNNLYISRPGDYETFDLIEGVLPIDPTAGVSINQVHVPVGITDLQEYRGSLYVWFYSATYSINDNGDVPSTWPITPIDQSLGSFPNGVTLVFNTNAISIDYLLIASDDGLYAFNGAYIKPEVSWKIFDLWRELEFDMTNANKLFKGRVQVVNDIFHNKIYIRCGYLGSDYSNVIIMGDYRQTSPTDPEFYKNIKWTVWEFDPAFILTDIFMWYIISATNILIAEYTSGDLYELGGSDVTKEVQQNAIFDTMYIRDETDSVVHVNMVRFAFRNATGINQTVDCSLINVGDGRTKAIQTMTVVPNVSKDIDKLTNFLSQKCYLHFSAMKFYLDRFWIFAKSTYQTIPK